MVQHLEIYEKIEQECRNSGIDLDNFLGEVLLELVERKRILFTPSKDWFLSHSGSLDEYYRRILGFKPDIQMVRDQLELLRNFFSTDVRKGLNLKERLDKLKEQNERCRTCGTLLTVETAVEDHIISIAMGGRDNYENIQLTCEKCNAGKSDTTNFASLCTWKISNSDLREGPKLTPSLRYAILARDRNACMSCSKSTSETRLLVVRKVDKQFGGQIVYDNLVTICESCLIKEGKDACDENA